MNTNITIINDCRDENAKGRQLIRANSLFGQTANFIGVSKDLEAAGNLIDAIDALGDEPGTILVNVAPRDHEARKWGNGTPFGYFWHKNVLVVASIDGLTLSLVKKFQLTEQVNVLDIPATLDVLISKELLDPGLKDHISLSQFRSYDFLPRIGAFLSEHKEIESKKVMIQEFNDAPPAVWFIDNFGNCKTTLISGETKEEDIEKISGKFGKIEYYKHLKDVPDNTPALITGSSGINDKRFLEIVVQGGSAAKHFNLSVGDTII